MLWKCCTQCHQIWKTQQCLQDWKRSVFTPIPKKGNSKECSNCSTIALISHARKVMLKILQWYVKWELTDVHTGFRSQRNKRPNCQHPLDQRKSKENSRKNNHFCFIDYAKDFDCMDQNKLGNSSRGGHTRPLTCLLRNVYAGQEATVRTGHGTTDWFQIGKGWCQGCVLSPCLFNLYAEYIMQM